VKTQKTRTLPICRKRFLQLLQQNLLMQQTSSASSSSPLPFLSPVFQNWNLLHAANGCCGEKLKSGELILI
jgi:hypothetical protein